MLEMNDEDQWQRWSAGDQVLQMSVGGVEMETHERESPQMYEMECLRRSWNLVLDKKISDWSVRDCVLEME